MSEMIDWQPSASLANLQARAAMLSDIRQFFQQRNVMEVETPLLASAPVTDPHLVNFETQFASPMSPDQQTLYLQTSPEYAMKRLLTSGSGCIYQICKAFRNEEAGRSHNPEFTMLEWYRIGFDHWQLMDEVSDLVSLVLGCGSAARISYQDAFNLHLNINPLACSLSQLKETCIQQGFADIAAIEDNKDTLLQLLFSHCIEPEIGGNKPCLVYHFPATQSALARLSPKDNRVAERFELYYQGIELANGFHELSDPQEQARRFNADNNQRIAMGRPAAPIDHRLLSALQAGFPNCAGVALGLDRLLMLKTHSESISQTLSFGINKA